MERHNPRDHDILCTAHVLPPLILDSAGGGDDKYSHGPRDSVLPLLPLPPLSLLTLTPFTPCLQEEETTMIAMTIKDLQVARQNPLGAYSSTYTHCEVHPSMILGEGGGGGGGEGRGNRGSTLSCCMGVAR